MFEQAVQTKPNSEHCLNVEQARISDKAMCHSNLSILLSYRFEQLGSMGDLSEANKQAYEAVQLTDPRSPSLLLRLVNYGNALKMKHLRSKDPQHLNEVINEYTKALKLCRNSLPWFALVANTLGAAHRLRHEICQNRNSDDLDKALNLHSTVLSSLLEEGSKNPKHLNNYAGALFARYKRDGTCDDLISAVNFAGEARESVSLGEIIRCSYADGLGELLLEQYH